MKKLKERMPGVILILLLAIPAWYLGRRFPIIGSPIIGILFGMLIAVLKKDSKFDSGIVFTSKKVLQYAIILLGFDMNLYSIFNVGSQTLVLMIFTLAATFLTAYLIRRLIKIDQNTNILIGVGTAICGGSAIAATAPVIGASDKEIARAISTIFLFNVIAAFLFPLIGHAMQMTDYQFGIWAGTAINDTSSVVAAAYTYSDTSGNLAVIVKLTRTLFIIPITLILALISIRKTKGDMVYKPLKIFPWFILGFIGASILSTFLPLPISLSKKLSIIGKFMIVMAMTGIGLNTNIFQLIKHGWKPICLGFICWIILSITSCYFVLL